MVELLANWDRTYDVAQWATGNVGVRSLVRVIEHPKLNLVGLWVYSRDKVGRDAGEIAGIAPTGVKATHDIGDILAARPDCVLYMPHVMNFDEVCELLEAGINIVTTRTEFQSATGLDTAVRARVEEACRRGNSSIHGTGSSPGFITEVLPIAITSIQRRLDCLTIYEFADNASRNSPEMLFGIMSFGQPPGPVPEGMLNHMRDAFAPALELVAGGLGLRFDGVEAKGSQGTLRKNITIAAGNVAAGTVGATRIEVAGLYQGKPLMRFVATWYVSSDVETPDDEEWLFRDSGWRVLLEGDCPLDINIRFPVSEADYPNMTPGLTAHRPVNVIPYVCAARQGIVTTLDLPQVLAKLG